MNAVQHLALNCRDRLPLEPRPVTSSTRASIARACASFFNDPEGNILELMQGWQDE